MWFKVDDGFYDHPKADMAGTAAVGLWARCGAYAARHLTDGFVPESVARRYGNPAMIKALLSAELWRRVDGGYQFHDWEDMNPSRKTVESQRDAAADRKRKSRAGHGLVTRDETVTGVVTDVGVTRASRGRVDPTRPDLKNNPPASPQSGKAVDTGAEVVPFDFGNLARQPAYPVTSPGRKWSKPARESTTDREWAHNMELVNRIAEREAREQQ